MTRSIVSKDSLFSLRVLDPSVFLDEDAISECAVNSVEENDKRSEIMRRIGEDSHVFEEFLKKAFSNSAMNVCKTKDFTQMDVTPMVVEL